MKKVLAVLGLSIILNSSVLAEEPKEAPKEQPQTVEAKKVDTTAMKDAAVTKTVADSSWTTTKSGLKWREKVAGKGAVAAMNMKVNCHYTVWLTDPDGKKGKLVQSSKGSSPYPCTIGQNLIAGWSEGMVGMKAGGTRELRIPPAIGYGDKAMGGDMIPANSILYFEIEFLNEVKQ